MLSFTMSKFALGRIEKAEGNSYDVVFTEGSPPASGLRPRSSDKSHYSVGVQVICGYFMDNEGLPYIHCRADDFPYTTSI